MAMISGQKKGPILVGVSRTLLTISVPIVP